mgnify:CR=1 FL=1
MQNNSDIAKFLSELNIKNELNIEEDLGNGYVRLKISEAERRQALQDINCVEDIIIELLRNSRDASSSNIFIGTKKIGDRKRIIHFIDDGIGIPPPLHNIIFESRVTSKLEDGTKDSYGFHGRGMALFSIKLNIDDIKITYSDNTRGTSFYLDIDLNKTGEKKDQSIMPQIIKANGNLNTIGGVNNIIKKLIEFNLQYKEINLYYGTPTQILTTMRWILKKENKYDSYPKFEEWKNFYDYINKKTLKVSEFPALTENYNLMEKISKDIFNMDISKRNIQRIIYNEIRGLNPMDVNSLKIYKRDSTDLVELKPVYNKEEKSKYKDNKIGGVGSRITKNNNSIGLFDELKLANRFKDEEIKCIIKLIEKKIKELGNKYFITISKDIEFKRANNILSIIVELKEKD